MHYSGRATAADGISNQNHNAFLTDGWADNEFPAEEASSGWVSAFLTRLRGHLGRELRHQSEGDWIFIDYEYM